jgi:hypothetical protein
MTVTGDAAVGEMAVTHAPSAQKATVDTVEPTVTAVTIRGPDVSLGMYLE